MKIHVTDKHIDRGVAFNFTGCAIALACEEQLPAFEASVGRIMITFRHVVTGQKRIVNHNVTNFVDAFDSFKGGGCARPEPFTFELELPREMLPKIPEPNERRLSMKEK